MPELWLVRHAPTADNEAGVVMGGLDAEPLEQGLRRAAEAGPEFALRGFGTVLSSPKRRALLTAKAFFPGTEIAVDERLRERDLGDWEGTAKRDLPPAALSRAGYVRLTARPPGGESPSDFGARVRDLLKDLTAIAQEGPICAVTHNGVIRMALHLTGAGLEDASEAEIRFLEPTVVDLGRELAPPPGSR